MSQWLIFLAIIPLSSIHLTEHFQAKHRWALNGIAFGAVIAPVSFGFLQMTYIPLIGKLLGLVGLLANLTHGSIGYICLLGGGFVEVNAAITAQQFILINLVNGLFFASCYGLIGYSLDRKTAAESGREQMLPV